MAPPVLLPTAKREGEGAPLRRGSCTRDSRFADVLAGGTCWGGVGSTPRVQDANWTLAAGDLRFFLFLFLLLLFPLSFPVFITFFDVLFHVWILLKK